MKRRIIGIAVTLWIVGIFGLVGPGWAKAANLIPLASFALIGVAGFWMALSKRHPRALTTALGATLLIFGFAPPPVDTLPDQLRLCAAFTLVLTAYYMVLLTLRTHTVAGPVLNHGSLRLGATIFAASGLTVALVLAWRSAAYAISSRWSVSLDSVSGPIYAFFGVLLLSIVTGISLLALSKTHPPEIEGRGAPRHASSGPLDAGLPR